MTGNTCFGWFQECKKAKTQFSMTVFKLVAGFDLCLPVSSPLFYVWFMMLGLFLREFKPGNQGLPAVSFGSKDQRIKGVKKNTSGFRRHHPCRWFIPMAGRAARYEPSGFVGIFLSKKIFESIPWQGADRHGDHNWIHRRLRSWSLLENRPGKLTFNGVMPNGSKWHELMIVRVEDVFRIQV